MNQNSFFVVVTLIALLWIDNGSESERKRERDQLLSYGFIK